MMFCKRCHTQLSSEAAARQHFADEHTEERRVEDLSLHLTGLTRVEGAMIVRLVERLRAGGDAGIRLRGQLRQILADAAELDGNYIELLAITELPL